MFLVADQDAAVPVAKPPEPSPAPSTPAANPPKSETKTDLVVTTYGTLRRDAGHLKDLEFEYAILDEAQAIKNSASQAAKACRLLTAPYRLATLPFALLKPPHLP